MSWAKSDVARSGQFILAEMIDGAWIDPFGTVQGDELLAAVRGYAVGWTPTSIELNYGFLFGIGGHTFIKGRATSDVSTMDVNSQIRAGFDGFLVIASTDFAVSVSDTDDGLPSKKVNEWGSTLQLIAIAVIAVAVVYGVRQIREISE